MIVEFKRVKKVMNKNKGYVNDRLEAQISNRESSSESKGGKNKRGSKLCNIWVLKIKKLMKCCRENLPSSSQTRTTSCRTRLMELLPVISPYYGCVHVGVRYISILIYTNVYICVVPFLIHHTVACFPTLNM